MGWLVGLALWLAVVHSQPLNVLDFGATGDGQTKDTEAIRSALAQCGRMGGCTIVFPGNSNTTKPRVYLTGSLVLSSNTDIIIEEGATVQGTTDPRDWGLVPAVHSYDWWGKSWNSEPRYGALFQAINSSRIRLSGGGTIDGNGRWWWDHRDAVVLGRPMLIQTINSSDLVFENLTLTMSPMYHVHLLNCRNVLVSAVNISTSADGHNTDGIDPDSSKNVTIVGCSIETADDCVAIKAGQGRAGTAFNVSTSDVLVAHNHFGRCGGVAIGSEVAGGVERVVVRDNVFGSVGNVVRIKSCSDFGGFVRDVSFENNRITDKATTAVYVNACYECACLGTPGPDIALRVTNLTGATEQAGSFLCAPANPCKVSMTDVALSGASFSCENAVGTAANVTPAPCWISPTHDER